MAGSDVSTFKGGRDFDVGVTGVEVRTAGVLIALFLATPTASGMISVMCVSVAYTLMGTPRLSPSKRIETLLVVRTTSANKDFDVVSNQATLELFQGTDDALEGSGDIGKVGDTIADD